MIMLYMIGRRTDDRHDDPSKSVIWVTDHIQSSGGNFVEAEVNRNKRAPQCGVALICGVVQIYDLGNNSHAELRLRYKRPEALALTIYFGMRR